LRIPAGAPGRPVTSNFDINGGGLVTTSEQRIRDFLDSDRAAWYHHVNITVHDRGGHFIQREIPGEWVGDLRRTFRGRR
jgi:hypothetical protein